MIKQLFSLIALLAIASGTALRAQNSLLATLFHNGDIQTFYSATALRDAHAAAQNGDIITLSSGTFVACDITKAVTIRGAGMDVNTLRGTLPTIITGDFTLNVPDTVSSARLTIEGIYHNHRIGYKGTQKNVMFLKSRFRKIEPYSTSHGDLKNASFIHCKITACLNIGDNSSATLTNCYVYSPNSSNIESSNFQFDNSVVYFFSPLVYSSSFTNCYIANSNSNSTRTLHSSNSAYNCVSSGMSDFFKEIPNTTNSIVSDISSVFKTYNGSNYSDNETFELTEAAAAKYLGMDGSQIGLHGGILPYSNVPSNPQITKFNVAAKSTADGKLSVDIEVNGAE